ncbi:MAG: MBL fold metallo-hydrolase [Fibrobacter sp.]|nr:MBL fold metallo-hydrolase [Fibrobacter sp.]
MKIQQYVVNSYGVNAFILNNDAGDAILIDPSVSNIQERKVLADYISTNKLTIKRLLNTHLHLDHILGNAFIENTYNVKAEAHEEDAFLLDLQEEQSSMYGMPFEQAAPALGDYLAHDDIVDVPGIKLKVIHVAGHSPGGIAFYCENPGEVVFNGTAAGKVPPLLFAGDILFAGGRGRSDLFGGDDDMLVSGIKTRLLTLPEDTIVLPGHGPFTTIGDERSNF